MRAFAGARAVITGGLGFIGSTVARRLLGLGAGWCWSTTRRNQSCSQRACSHLPIALVRAGTGKLF
ncbi:MAG: NAD-dependent epimerase/dehydratase family protein [Stellaceae bacterium]